MPQGAAPSAVSPRRIQKAASWTVLRDAFGVPQVEVNLCAGVGLVRRNSTDYGRKDRFPLRYRVKLWRRRHIEFKRRHSDLDPVPDEDLNEGGANPSSSWIVDDNGTRR
jgi:hypothetical protein